MRLKHKILIVFGFLFLGLGLLGIFLPVLPTTPFVLLASACFASNQKLSDWLSKSKLFGEYITNYKERNGLKKITVIKSLGFLWIMLLLSMYLIGEIWALIMLTIIGSAVTVHILVISRPKENSKNEEAVE
ncbi:MAG: YbaN family protein [Lachnospiraceae bacterium]|nr:YbaN family protein [Lachnospiraceae bacterium]